MEAVNEPLRIDPVYPRFHRRRTFAVSLQTGQAWRGTTDDWQVLSRLEL